MKESVNVSKDVVRDHLLRKLYEFNQTSRSPKKVAVLPSVLQKAMKASYGYKQQEVASNLDYLVEKGWVKEIVENRTFKTPAGTTQNSERRTYKISAAGVDRLEEASLFKNIPMGTHVNITNINGVTVVGDGNVVNTKFTDLSRILGELRKRIGDDSALSDEVRLNAISDLDGITTQLQKPAPNLTVVRVLWEGIKAAVTVGSAVTLLEQANHYLSPLLK
jgi:hypothetical protein